MRLHHHNFKNFAPILIALALLVPDRHVTGSVWPTYRRDFDPSPNARFIVWRAADFGVRQFLAVEIDGVPIVTLPRGIGYDAIVRPGPHVLTVSNTPSVFGKTKFTHHRVMFRPGQTYAYTAVWYAYDVILEPAGQQARLHHTMPW